MRDAVAAHRQPLSFAQWRVDTAAQSEQSSQTAVGPALLPPSHHRPLRPELDGSWKSPPIATHSHARQQHIQRWGSGEGLGEADGARTSLSELDVQEMRAQAAAAVLRREAAKAAAAAHLRASEEAELTSEALEAAGLPRARREELLRLLESPMPTVQRARRPVFQADATAYAKRTRYLDSDVADIPPRIFIASPPAQSASSATGTGKVGSGRPSRSYTAFQSAVGLPASASHVPTTTRGLDPSTLGKGPLEHLLKGDVSFFGASQDLDYCCRAVDDSADCTRRMFSCWVTEAATRRKLRHSIAQIVSIRRKQAWGDWRCAQLREMIRSITEGYREEGREQSPSCARRFVSCLPLANASQSNSWCTTGRPDAFTTLVAAVLHSTASNVDGEGRLGHPSASCQRIDGIESPRMCPSSRMLLRRWRRRSSSQQEQLARTLAGWRLHVRASLRRWSRVATLDLMLESSRLYCTGFHRRRHALKALMRWRQRTGMLKYWASRGMLLRRVWEGITRRVLQSWWQVITAETRREAQLIDIATQWELEAAVARPFDRMRRLRAAAISHRHARVEHTVLVRRAATVAAFERWAAHGRAKRAFLSVGLRWHVRRSLATWYNLVSWCAATRLLRQHMRKQLIHNVWTGWRQWVSVRSRYERLLAPLRANRRKPCRGLPLWMHAMPQRFSFMDGCHKTARHVDNDKLRIVVLGPKRQGRG